MAVKRNTLVHRGRNFTKADIYECEFHGRKAILKDYGSRNNFVSRNLGKWFAGREFSIYQKLRGISGIAESLGSPDAFSFVIEYTEGKPLPDLDAKLITSSVFNSLRETIETIHGKGIACGDIHHRDILVTGDGRSYLVDFATGWEKGSRYNIIRNIIFHSLCCLDWLAFYRIRERYLGIPPSMDEKNDFSSIIPLYSLGRALKKMFDLLRGKEIR
ncbi:MAG: hypothetical protein AB1756_04565 [Acidobacteriota bacterium]